MSGSGMMEECLVKLKTLLERSEYSILLEAHIFSLNKVEALSSFSRFKPLDE